MEIPSVKAEFTHSRLMDVLKGQSFTNNAAWTDVISQIPWGTFKEEYPDAFYAAGLLSSLNNMHYQICNGGVYQYFDNGYDRYRDPYHKDDVCQYDIDEQKKAFLIYARFAREVMPWRKEENDAFTAAAETFQKVVFEENVHSYETVECYEPEFIEDEEGNEIPNPDWFEDYEEDVYEDVIHGEFEFESAHKKVISYFEEILELRAQYVCKSFVQQLEQKADLLPGLLTKAKEIFPASAFKNQEISDKHSSLEDKIQSAEVRASSLPCDSSQTIENEMIPQI